MKLRYLVGVALLLGGIASSYFETRFAFSSVWYKIWDELSVWLLLLFLSVLTNIRWKRFDARELVEGSREFVLLLAASIVVAVIGFVLMNMPCGSDDFLGRYLGEAGCQWVTDVAAFGAPLVWIALAVFAYRRYRTKWRWVLLGWPFALLPWLMVLLVIGLWEICEYRHPGQCAGF